MSISLYNVNKWLKMVLGKSKLHVNQGLGKFYSSTTIAGYYNDLREKVIFEKKITPYEIPMTQLENGSYVFFPTAIFQYGLGSYDLYLEKNSDEYLLRFCTAVNWAMENQNDDGSWNNFVFSKPDHPFSCMSQGEGASLLIRAYINSKNDIYLKSAKKAIDFMVEFTVQKNNGDGNVILLEYTDQSAVLNGWIFGLFGLYDYLLLNDLIQFNKISEDKTYKNIFADSIATLKNSLAAFDLKFWSSYDLSGSIISSRFYHKLHISQLKALYELTKENTFKIYYEKFERYDKNLIYRFKAFIIKVIQKIKE